MHFPQLVTWGAYHSAKISENSSWNVNGKVIFRKFHPEILDYLQRYSSFSIWNEQIENYPYHLTVFLSFSLSAD